MVQVVKLGIKRPATGPLLPDPEPREVNYTLLSVDDSVGRLYEFLEARGELDDTKRADIYREVQLIIRDEGGVVVPAFANMVMAVGANVGTDENIGASWDLDGGHCVKRWWLTG